LPSDPRRVRLDRLGRSLADLIRLTQELQGRGNGFASLTEHIGTRSPAEKLVFHMFGALA
jgi:DNA invertase Pin-like site-specific DNA recombinase